MLAPVSVASVAHVGYRTLDARRYERRRYGGLRQRANLWLLERAIARVLDGVPRDRPVLDVPCGTGILDRMLGARGHVVVASDLSPAMLGVARERRTATRHVLADLERPPWRRGAFGAVVCARFLMHVPAARRPRVLTTLAALTDGPLVATVCHPYTLKSATRALRRLLGMRAKRSPRLTRRALAHEAAAAGLHIEQIVPLVPLFSEVWVVVLR